MAEFLIEQAVYFRPDGQPPRRVAESSGFCEEWQPHIERLLLGFGERPGGMRCPPAVFAQPLGKKHVAVVHVADRDDVPGFYRPQEDAARSPAPARAPWLLGFHLLILLRRDYARFIGDPFAVAERYPPRWQARGALPALTWPEQPPPLRTVAQLRQVLQRVKASALSEDQDPEKIEATPENAESPALLGGVQVLVDGGRVAFERPASDTALMQGLWTLLPHSTRNTLWPASFAFGNALHFDALITPRISGPEYEGYCNEDQASEYPAGRYELSLQTAAEAGDQGALDALLTRRSSAETLRLALVLLVLFVVIVVGTRLVDFGGPEEPVAQEERARGAVIAASLVGMHDPLPVLTVAPAARLSWNKIPSAPKP